MDFSTDALMRFAEKWWHFGHCPRCLRRYSDWFTVTHGDVRYCYPCAAHNGAPTNSEDTNDG